MTFFVCAYINLVNQIKLPGNVINDDQVNIYILSSAGGDSVADRGRSFGCLFETLASSIKIKFKLNFILYIASFQLA